MKAIVLYVSRYKGNTERLAHAIARELGCVAKSVTEVRPEELGDFEVVGLGSGVYAWGLDRRLKRVLSKTPTAQKKKFFVFSTSADPSGLKYHANLTRWMRRRGLSIIGEFNCPGEYAFPFLKRFTINPGRPNSDDLDRAQEFARSLRNT